ncbi:MAG TPA: hypothetical protein DCX03_06470 [Bacteroidales bacterium]|nr:hypothetical protein [Bacteroidales bacterium]
MRWFLRNRQFYASPYCIESHNKGHISDQENRISRAYSSSVIGETRAVKRVGKESSFGMQAEEEQFEPKAKKGEKHKEIQRRKSINFSKTKNVNRYRDVQNI